ncbi:hypothetical protein AT6N2_C3055 [Agrobacterium tumefaciens]|nr:hypothetical protein AT6N2_C3055 [Agrobacterium tumefaciens]
MIMSCLAEDRARPKAKTLASGQQPRHGVMRRRLSAFSTAIFLFEAGANFLDFVLGEMLDADETPLACSTARSSSSSFASIAAESLFCEFCTRKIIRKVTMVVPVLMTSCQTSENPKSGPLMPQTITVPSATTKAVGEPENDAIRLANCVKNLFMARCTSCLTMPTHLSDQPDAVSSDTMRCMSSLRTTKARNGSGMPAA